MDLYAALGLQRPCDAQQVSRAFRASSRRCHPDLFGAKSENEQRDARQRFEELEFARSVLCDPVLRELYHEKGLAGVLDHQTRAAGAVEECEASTAPCLSCEEEELPLGAVVPRGSSVRLDLGTGRVFLEVAVAADDGAWDVIREGEVQILRRMGRRGLC